MRSRGIVATLAIAALSNFPLHTTATVRPSHLDPRSQCYSGVFTLVARGSEEPQGQSVLETIASSITAAIPNSGSNEVVYPALLSFWNSAPTGVTNAQQQLLDYYSACPDGKIVIMGYSQGSYVMSTTLAGGNYSGQNWAPLGSNIGQNIAAVVLFGDQSRMLGQGTIAEGTNCADPCTATSPLALTSPYNSSMEAYTDRLEEWCAAADPICCKTGTDIQAHLSYWSTNTTDTVVQFVQSQLGNSSATSSATSSTTSPATTSSMSPSTSSLSQSSVSSSLVSIVSSQSSIIAAATHSSSDSSTTATSQATASATGSPSPSASASTSGGSQPAQFTATWKLVSFCLALLSGLLFV